MACSDRPLSWSLPWQENGCLGVSCEPHRSATTLSRWLSLWLPPAPLLPEAHFCWWVGWLSPAPSPCSPAPCPRGAHLHRAPLTACLWFSFQAERPALNVVIFPLLHEGLTNVIRDVPMVHLDEITLFKSRVAEEPPNLWW